VDDRRAWKAGRTTVVGEVGSRRAHIAFGITGVADAVEIPVRLAGVGYGRAVVGRITDVVSIDVPKGAAVKRPDASSLAEYEDGRSSDDP